MRVELVCVGDIAEAEYVELLLAISSCGVDRKEDGPGDTAPNQADDDRYLQVPEQKIAIKGVVLQYESIWELIEGLQPPKKRLGQSRSTLLREETSQISSRRVLVWMAGAQN